MKFNENLRNWVPVEQLWDQSGGDLKFNYDHKTYWPALEAETTRRRQAYKERWVAAGRKIGEYEEYLRGGNQKSISAILDDAQKSSSAVTIDGTHVDIDKLKV